MSAVATEGRAVAVKSRAAWEEVVERLVADRGDALTRYALFMCGNREDAADLVQEALVKTFGRLRNGFTIASAESYVRRAILTTYLDAGRRSSRWRKIAHLEAVPEVGADHDAEIAARVDLQAQLMTLTARERACVVLRYYDDLKVDDIASELKLSSGAVKRYLSDGLAKLKITLVDDGGTVDSQREGRFNA